MGSEEARGERGGGVLLRVKCRDVGIGFEEKIEGGL